MPKVMLEMEMPKSCDECPLCYPKTLLSGKKMCLWEQGYRFHRMLNGDKKASWEIPNEIKSGEKLSECPLQEVKE